MMIGGSNGIQIVGHKRLILGDTKTIMKIIQSDLFDVIDLIFNFQIPSNIHSQLNKL